MGREWGKLMQEVLYGNQNEPMDKGVVLDLKTETNKQGPHCVTQADFKHSVFWVLGLQVCHHAQRFTHIKQALYHGAKFMAFHSLFFIFLDARLWHF